MAGVVLGLMQDDSLRDAAFGAVLLMKVATTLIAPPFIILLFKGEEGDEAGEAPLPVTPIS